MHPFRAYISMYTELSDEDWQIIKPCLTYKIVQANRMLLKPSTICKNLYFLENGLMKQFTIDDSENPMSREIFPPFLFTSAHSFAKQTPSKEGIQAVEESYIWMISREDAYWLLEMPAWNSFLSKL